MTVPSPEAYEGQLANRAAYACCEHCDHDGSGLPPDQHTRPCKYGCNDTEAAQ